MGTWNGSSWRNKGIEEEGGGGGGGGGEGEEEEEKEEEQQQLRNIVYRSNQDILYFQNAVWFHGVGALKYNFIRSHDKITIFLAPSCTNLSSAQSIAWSSSMPISPRCQKI